MFSHCIHLPHLARIIYHVLTCFLCTLTHVVLGHVRLIILPIAKNTTNISQIYHKYTTKVLQNVILYHKNVILYHKTECFTTKCNILPHSEVFFKNNPTTNCSILLQNIVIYHKMMYYIMNSSISTTEVVFYHIM